MCIFNTINYAFCTAFLFSKSKTITAQPITIIIESPPPSLLSSKGREGESEADARAESPQK